LDGDEVAVLKKQVVTPDRLGDRRKLLSSLDAFRRDTDRAARGADTHHQKAFDVLTTSKLVDAIDVTKEPEKLRDRYGRGSPPHPGDGAPLTKHQRLRPRRLLQSSAARAATS